MEIPIHTIILLVGPTNCGKTTFAQKHLIPSLHIHAPGKLNIQNLSSDEIRQEILGKKLDKYHPLMLQASKQAFSILRTKLSAVTSFPINAHFVVVDTTGLSENFRDEMLTIAKENHYHLSLIVFDYKKRDYYYSLQGNNRIISQHLTKLRKEVIPNLKKNKYPLIWKVKDLNFNNVEIRISNLEEYLSHQLDPEVKWTVIGDTHCCVDELKLLLKKEGFIEGEKVVLPPGRGVVLLGDYIDRGEKVVEMIEFLYTNRSTLKLIAGNHEKRNYEILNSENDNQNLQYYTSVETFRSNVKARAEFFVLYREHMKIFYQCEGKFIATHSPCENKYLGKLTSQALKRQQYFRFNFDQGREQIKTLETGAEYNAPYHVFGHLAFSETYRFINLMGIDTGCIVGNKLTAVTFSFRPFFTSQNFLSRQKKNDGLLLSWEKPRKQVSLDDLSLRNVRRLNHMLKKKINFVSGTMAPADKLDSDLESLEAGIRYFQAKGVEQLNMQPKYMGSRCNVYLNQNVEKCFVVSRNGFIIQHVDLSSIFPPLLLQFGKKMEEDQISWMILDGELLPWSVLGKGMIKEEFGNLSLALHAESAFLDKFRYQQALDSLVQDYQASDFSEDAKRMSKKELGQKYQNPDRERFREFRSSSFLSIQEMKMMTKVYQKQLDLYGQPGEMIFKPFTILKIEYTDGRMELPVLEQPTSQVFSTVNNDDFCLLQLNDERVFEKAKKFFETITLEKRMEGVVLKPEVILPNCAPYMKVRNSQYLTLVYGYDYTQNEKYENLLKRKDVKRKLRTSIDEFDLGMKMLQTPMEEIDPSHEKYRQLIANLIFEVEKEAELDPRL